jgi:hypothetical protein
VLDDAGGAQILSAGVDDGPEAECCADDMRFDDDGGIDEIRLGATPDMLMADRCVEPIKKLEIAAGARIDQSVYPDPKRLRYWRDEPSAMIVINYTDVVTMQKVLESGRRQASEGFVGASGVPVGHVKQHKHHEA